MPKVDAQLAGQIKREVITELNTHLHPDKKPLPIDTPYEELKDIGLMKFFGMGHTLIVALAIPLGKISQSHGGTKIGVFDMEDVSTAQFCVDLVIQHVKANKG